MKIACPSCSAKYSLADEKVQSRLAKIRCRKCGTTIVIDGRVDPPSIQTADGQGAQDDAYGGEAAGGEPAGDEYTVDIAENDQRNMTIAQIVEAYNTGVVTADTFVWKDGMADWQALGEVPEINEALHRAARASSMPPAGPAVAAAAPVVAAAAPVVAATAARTASGRGAAADLFGGIDVAGSERDVATSAAQPAGGGVSAATGARNESSVLFSLSALTSSQEAAPGKSATTEDSGLIDLAALTSGAQPAATADSSALDLGSAPLAASPFGASPFGAAPLTGGTAAPLGLDATPAKSSNKNGLFIAGGLIAATLIAGLFAFLLKEEPQPVVAAPPSTVFVEVTPAPTPTPEPVAEKDEAEDEKETATAQASAKRAAAPKPKSGGSTAKPPTSSAGGSETAKPDKPKEASKPAPAKSKCNCKAGDLMCEMKCSAKKK